MRKVNVSQMISESKLNKNHIAIFIVCLLVIIFNGYDQSVYGIALPSLMEDTGIGAAVFGTVGTATLVGMFLGSMAFGLISDHIGRPKALILGVAIFCFGTGMFGFSHTIPEFAIYRIIAGFGMAGVVPVAIPIVSEYSPLKARPVMTTWVTAGVPIGAIITPLIGMAMLPKVGWRMMYLSGFFPAIIILFILLIVPESMERLVTKHQDSKIVRILQKTAPQYTPQKGDIYVTDSISKGKTKSSLKDLFTEGRTKTTLLFWITFFCTMFFTYGMQTWLPNLMINAGFPIQNSMIFMFVYAAGSIPSLMMTDFFVSKFGYKKSVMILTGIAAASIALLALQPNAVFMYILLFLAGAGMYGETGIFYSYISASYPNSVRSTALGFASAVGRIGGMFGPVIGGALTAAGAPLASCFLAFAIPMGCATLCIAFTREKVNL